MLCFRTHGFNLKFTHSQRNTNDHNYITVEITFYSKFCVRVCFNFTLYNNLSHHNSTLKPLRAMISSKTHFLSEHREPNRDRRACFTLKFSAYSVKYTFELIAHWILIISSISDVTCIHISVWPISVYMCARIYKCNSHLKFSWQKKELVSLSNRWNGFVGLPPPLPSSKSKTKNYVPEIRAPGLVMRNNSHNLN